MASAADTIESTRSARRIPIWLDRADRPGDGLTRDWVSDGGVIDLVVVGGGLTGLWAAFEAATAGQRVVVVDAALIGQGASGRCGGFVNASITHGIAHGHARWPDEMPAIVALQDAIWDDTLALLARAGADGVIEPVGKLVVATRPHQLAGLDESAALFERYGEAVQRLDLAAVRAEVDSPTYLGGIRQLTANGLCDPARLIEVLASLAVDRGVELAESVRVESLDGEARGRVTLRCDGGRRLVARRVLLATNAHRALHRTPRRRVIPVYDHVIATAPLDDERWAEIGWRARCGVTDAGNRFHYYRPTPDGRILFGGWDATYHFPGRLDARHDDRPETHALLAAHLIDTFPALAGVEITHAWGGAIDSTSRFTPMFGTAMDRRLAWAVGFTGLGVGSSRFAALTALDLLAGESTDRTRLSMVRRAPIPFPPEPLRSPVIALTKRALAREDETGRRGPWLRLLDRFGIGFDT